MLKKEEAEPLILALADIENMDIDRTGTAMTLIDGYSNDYEAEIDNLRTIVTEHEVTIANANLRIAELENVNASIQKTNYELLKRVRIEEAEEEEPENKNDYEGLKNF